MLPQPGDVLASARTARADLFLISIVPGPADVTENRHSDAVEKVRGLAHRLQVDGWFTYDHTHYARVAAFRAARRGGSAPEPSKTTR
jgi:hypothetical protein